MLSPKDACEDHVRKKYRIKSNIDLGNVCSQNGQNWTLNCSVDNNQPGLVNEFGNCTPASCPPGTKRVGGKCVKIADAGDGKTKDAAIVNLSTVKASKCDEKWYDWFSNQFYHLGNRPQKDGDTCYGACKTGYVPFTKYDAVTDKTYVGTDDLDKCVPVSLHLAGKYKGAPLHCPTAWIRRLGKTRHDSVAEATRFIQRIPEKNRADPHIIERAMNIARKEAEKAHSDAIHLIPGGAELSMSSNVACRHLDAERHTETYDICKSIDTKYIENLKRDSMNMGLGESHGKYREVMLKAMCDTKFCKSDNLCFADARKEARSMKGFDPTVRVDDSLTGFRVFRGMGVFDGDITSKIVRFTGIAIAVFTLLYVIWVFFLRDIVVRAWIALLDVLKERRMGARDGKSPGSGSDGIKGAILKRGNRMVLKNSPQGKAARMVGKRLENSIGKYVPGVKGMTDKTMNFAADTAYRVNKKTTDLSKNLKDKVKVFN